MRGLDRRNVQNFDWMLLGIVGLLILFGIVNLMSATHSGSGESVLSDELRRQLISLGIGGVAMLLVVAIDYRHYERLAVPVYAASMVLLAVTLVIAPVTRGSQSWLFGGRVQPAEFARIAMILMLARYFSRNSPGEIRRVTDLARPAMIGLLPVGLIVLQRDMGVALLTLLVAGTYLAFVRIPWRVLAGGGRRWR